MSLDTMKIDEFTELLGSSAPAPGGGGAASLTAALGAALAEMVCSITLGNKKYADSVEEMTKLKARFREYEKSFLLGMEEDKEAFLCVSRAYKMPKDTEEEKAAKKQAVQDALKISVVPPVKLMKNALEALLLTGELPGKTAASAVSDIGVAAINLNAAIKGAWLNVLINIGGFEDRDLADGYLSEGRKILEKAGALTESISAEVEKAIK